MKTRVLAHKSYKRIVFTSEVTRKFDSRATASGRHACRLRTWLDPTPVPALFWLFSGSCLHFIFLVVLRRGNLGDGRAYLAVIKDFVYVLALDRLILEKCLGGLVEAWGWRTRGISNN